MSNISVEQNIAHTELMGELDHCTEVANQKFKESQKELDLMLDKVEHAFKQISESNRLNQPLNDIKKSITE